jgi:3-dehydroquinate synthase
LEAFGLPVERDPTWPVDTIIEIMRSDKKAEAGQLRFILPVRAGEVRLFADVTVAEVVAALGPSK